MRTVTALISLLAPAAALVAGRRELIARAVAGSVAIVGSSRFSSPAAAVSARTGLSSPFTGEYDDPQHPGCLRSVKIVGGSLGPDGRRQKIKAEIKGVDDACSAGRPQLSQLWSVTGTPGKTEDGVDTLMIDFSSKGGPKNMLATFDNFGGVPGIVFPDGNKWVKVPGGTPDRRPPAVTLSTDEA